MQVINETLELLGKMAGKMDKASENELELDDELFLMAHMANAKAVAGLALAIKEGGLQPRAAQLQRAADNQAIELLVQVRDAYTKNGKLPPIELVLHTVNEALKALGRR